jgi:anti-sigma regulatory factor (Ser/Thr protein kinase)
VEGALLALHEAIVNADKHGGGPTRAEAILEDSVLVLRVTDAGPGFDPHRYINVTPDLEAESGRGLWLMSRVASWLDVEHGHDGVSVVIRFEARAAA